jgi:Tol biopolymer transport system component
LFTVDPVTKDTARVGYGGDGDPAWSPSGEEIAIRTTSAGPGDGILIIAYPTGETSVVECSDPDDGECSGEGPTWSPDGNWIAFEDGLEILKVPRLGGETQEIVHWDLDVTEPSWSPDGSWIAFEGGDSTFSNGHIWVVDARGESYGLYQVTSGEVRDTDPSWSPDSRTIYFASNRSGQYEIWKVGFNASASSHADQATKQ